MTGHDKHPHDHSKPHPGAKAPAAATTLDHWPQIQAFLISTFTADVGSGTNAEADAAQNAPHAAFWQSMTYSQFVTGNVPGVTDPNTGAALPILIVGNSQKSNIVMALQGTPGSIFDPTTGGIGQMPQGFTPITAAGIQRLANWIDAGCPQ